MRTANSKAGVNAGVKSGVQLIGERVKISYGAGFPSSYGVITGFRVEVNEVIGSRHAWYTVTQLDGETDKYVSRIEPAGYAGIGVKLLKESEQEFFEYSAKYYSENS